MRLRKWANDVDMNVIKTAVGEMELVDWGRRMSVDFGLLASIASPSPPADISIQAIPNEARADELTSGFCAWVSRVVY